MAVVHNHSPNVVPFSVVKTQCFCAIMHMAAPVGRDVPNWDIRDKFGDGTNLLVTNMDMARDLAKSLGARTVALMRGHGCVVVGNSLREVVFTSIYTEINAQMLGKALALGEVTYLSDGEIAANTKGRAGFTLERGWENWCRERRPAVLSAGLGDGPGIFPNRQIKSGQRELQERLQFGRNVRPRRDGRGEHLVALGAR